MQKIIRFNNKLAKLCMASVLIAMGVVLSTFYIPVGSSKCFPMQHFINVVSAVLLGPWYAMVNAFVISLLRNLLGIGSVLAFPGSMIGAFLAGLAYEATKKHRIAILGELLGTGVLGALLAAPMAVLILGKDAGFFFFVLPFFLSSFAGSLIALILFEGSQLIFILKKKRESL